MKPKPITPAWFDYAGQERMRRVGEMRHRVAADRRRKQERLRLLIADPHCDNCRRRLQVDDHQAANYANLVSDRLSCPACVRIVRALAAVEGGE